MSPTRWCSTVWLKIEANFYAVTEWTPLAIDAAKKEVVKPTDTFAE